MPKIIVTSRFIRAGNHSKLNNYVKYIATREGVELTEQMNSQQNIDREIFINYLGTRPNVVKQGTHGLFSDTDEPIILDKTAKEVAQHNGTVWTHIVSLRRDDAERMGYNTPYGVSLNSRNIPHTQVLCRLFLPSKKTRSSNP